MNKTGDCDDLEKHSVCDWLYDERAGPGDAPILISAVAHTSVSSGIARSITCAISCTGFVQAWLKGVSDARLIGHAHRSLERHSRREELQNALSLMCAASIYV